MYLSGLRARRIIFTPSQLQLACREPYGRIFKRKRNEPRPKPNVSQYWYGEAEPGTLEYSIDEHNKPKIDAAREWLEQLSVDTIPKSETEVTMSRSSGPGGQNVNKVNSKVTLRIPFSTIEKHTPELLHYTLREHPYYAKNSDSLLINCDGSRYKKQNLDQVYKNLENLLRVTAEDIIPGETLDSQKQKVQGLKDEWLREKKKLKVFHSAKKAARRSNED